MSYWTEVKEVLHKGIDLALSNFKEGSEIAIEKGKDGVVYLHLRKELFTAHRELHNALADFGDIMYELYKTGLDTSDDGKVKKAAGKVADIEAKCKQIEKKISDIPKKS